MTATEQGESNEPDRQPDSTGQHPDADPAPPKLTPAEQASLAELNVLATIATAEHQVRLARIDDLTAQQQAARDRVVAAHDQLAQAQRTGDADQVAEARETLRHQIAEAKTAAAAAVQEIEVLADAHITQYHQYGQRLRDAVHASQAERAQAVQPGQDRQPGQDHQDHDHLRDTADDTRSQIAAGDERPDGGPR